MSHQYFGKRASFGALVAAFLYLAVATAKHTTITIQQYAAYVKNLIFLARLEFVSKTGCVPQCFQYKEVTLRLPQNLRLKLLIFRFLTSVAYHCCIIDLVQQYRTHSKKQESGLSVNIHIFFLFMSLFFSCFRRAEIMLVLILVLKRDSFI